MREVETSSQPIGADYVASPIKSFLSLLRNRRGFALL